MSVRGVSRLSDEERRLYFWILREFAAGVVPTGPALAATAAGFGIDLDDALVVLAREDLVHTPTLQAVPLWPDTGGSWQPAEAIVLAGSACCDGPSFRGCCDALNFFERAENAERYLAEHREITGSPVSSR